ncbi:MAG TPA: hypothetical protein VE988_22425, partial [Gemmataceae bacterium]|nr:hypothetical protein [Gemmataceae bacterium]
TRALGDDDDPQGLFDSAARNSKNQWHADLHEQRKGNPMKPGYFEKLQNGEQQLSLRPDEL